MNQVAQLQTTSVQPKPNLQNWQEIAWSYTISHTKLYSRPPVCIQLGNKDGEPSQFGSFGNFSVITGKAKSRKTFLLSICLTSCIKADSSQDKIRVILPNNKRKVILTDTEQSEYDVSLVARRIRTSANVENPENLRVLSLRALSPNDRLFLIEQLIYNTEDLGILIIDGIRDLISDINSPEEATMITSKLLKWTQEKHIHIMVVIHQNKGDNNARGHIGTELMNKAETVISVEKDNEVSIVKPEFVRGKDFDAFAFSVDSNGLAYIKEEWTPGKAQSAKQRLSPYDIPKETHHKVLQNVFVSKQPKKYKELETDLKVIFQSYYVNVSLSQVAEFISYYKLNNMLTDTGGKGRSGNQYSLHESLL